jgi:hypothetical protein
MLASYGIFCDNQNSTLPHATRWFLLRQILESENGGDTFLRNVVSHTDYTALYARDGNIRYTRVHKVTSLYRVLDYLNPFHILVPSQGC